MAGLLFATEEATDRPDVLAATLPFGGATLIEFQARLLIAAGAAQILIVVSRVTPELLGAAARLGKRGVAVDVVRTAAEAAAKIHPLSHVVVLADGLITTEEIIAPFTAEGGDLLLVSDASIGLERIDASSCWAGIARLGAQRLTEAARLPRDYDFLSSLLRVGAQHRAAKLMLPVQHAGHGVEHETRGLARRGRGVFAALSTMRQPWVERWVLGPIARLALPPLIARGASPLVMLAAGAVLAAAGCWAILADWGWAGLCVVALASVALLTGSMLATLRGDDAEAGWCDHAIAGASALAVLLLGVVDDRVTGEQTGVVLAVALIIAGGLVERARALTGPRRWWAAPAAYPLLLIPFALLGLPLAGLAAGALYAALTLLGAIEDARAKP